MKALIVLSHPTPGSLTHSVAAAVAAGIAERDPGDSSETADLMAEGFDPRFNNSDRHYFHEKAAAPPDVAAEQRRIDRTDALILVYPIYWWSMPGLLKGWIDRVFANGWAYASGADGKVEKKLRHKKVHLIAIGGADDSLLSRHGYEAAMRTQIDHGIFDYCGVEVASSTRMLESDTTNAQPHLLKAREIGRRIFSAA